MTIMLRVIFLLVQCLILTQCDSNTRFVICSENAFFNTTSTNELLKSLFSTETIIVQSAIECGRECNSMTDCMGINLITGGLPNQRVTCDIISTTGAVDSILHPCLLLEDHAEKVFYVKESFNEYERSWEEVFETVGTEVVFGSRENIKSRIQHGESFRVLLRDFDQGYDFLVDINAIKVYQSTVCAYSVHNFGLNGADITRSLLCICMSGKVEVQVWSDVLILEYILHDFTVKWFADNRQKKQIIGVNGEGNKTSLKSAIHEGQEVSICLGTSGYQGRRINSMFANSSFIALLHPWDLNASITDDDVTMPKPLYWMSRVFSPINKIFITSWYIESGQYIDNAYKERSTKYMSDKAWTKIDVNQVVSRLNDGKQLRVVFENRAETVSIVKHHTTLDHFDCGIDRMLQTTDDFYIDNAISQLYIVLTSTGEKAEYIFRARNYEFIKTTSPVVNIKWVIDNLYWTAVQLTSSTRDSNLPFQILSKAFDGGKRFRVKIIMESDEYFFTADNVIRDEDSLMASYFGYGFDFESDFGKTWLLMIWSNGTLWKSEHPKWYGIADVVYNNVDMWWFFN